MIYFPNIERTEKNNGEIMIKFPADLIFVKSPTNLGGAIRWFQRSRGESKSWTNHTAGIGTVNNVVEAQTRVISTPFDEWRRGKEFQLWRTYDLDDDGRNEIAQYIESHIGNKYGYAKLIPHALDGLLGKVTGGNVYLFRRMLFLENYDICSWLLACGYHLKGLDFGADHRFVTPDDQLDYCMSHPQKWEKTYDSNPNH